MWYAVQVRTGREENIIQYSKLLVDRQVLTECFLPKYEQKKKYRGEWHIEHKLLFPGYLFMISDTPDELYQALKNIPDLTKVLRDDDYLIPIKEEEKAFLLHFGKEEHVVEMSYGYMEGEKVTITEGPMKDFDGKIIKIDRHKRTAVIEVEFFDRKMEVKVGLEVVRKG